MLRVMTIGFYSFVIILTLSMLAPFWVFSFKPFHHGYIQGLPRRQFHRPAHPKGNDAMNTWVGLRLSIWTSGINHCLISGLSGQLTVLWCYTYLRSPLLMLNRWLLT